MGKSVETKKMIDILNEKFEGINAVPASDFYGKESDGIWFRVNEGFLIKDLPMYCDNVFPNTFGTNPRLEKVLSKHGWFSEPYDGVTLLAYKN